jgi:ABC-2 type transport system ATP-binding protein
MSTPISDERLGEYGSVTQSDAVTATLQVGRAETKEVAARMLSELPLDDISIEEPEIEEVIRQVFAQS